MHQLHLLPLLLFFFPCLLPAQDFFERYYDSGGAEVGGAIAIFDNNLTIAGYTNFNVADRLNGVLHTLDLNGNLRYTATIAANRRTLFRNLATVQLNGTPGIIAGSWNNVRTAIDDLTFYGFDATGEGNSFGWGNDRDDEQCWGLLSLDNGDILGVGEIATFNTAMVFRFSPDGTLRWRRTFSIPNTRFNVFQSAREVDDGLILVGYSTVAASDGQTILVKVSPEGDLIWSYRYDYPNDAFFYNRTLELLPNGDLIITSNVVTGTGTADILFLRLNGTGEVISKSPLGGAGLDRVQSILHTSRGTLILAGSTTSSVPEQETALVLEVNYDGQILRQRTLANSGNSIIEDLIAAPNGGYYLAGTATYCGEASDMLLVYLNDTLGNPLEFCPAVPINLTRKPAGNITRTSIGSMADRSEPTVTTYALEARSVNIFDRNCPLFDLDADDSSGSNSVYGFRIPDTCYNGPLPIMDVDAAFTVGQPLLTSVRISFTQLQEGESLTFPLEMAGQVESIGLNDYNFVNTQNLPADQVVALLKRIRYRNDNEVIVEGTREISLQTFFLCQTGNLALTRFYLRASGPFVTDLPDAVLCPGEELFVDATAAGATEYVWADGEQGAMRSIEEPGTYVVTISNACVTIVDTVVISAGEALGEVPNLSDQLLCPGNTVVLDVTTAGALVYQWSDGAQGAIRSIEEPGTYIVAVSNDCAATVDTIVVSSGEDLRQLPQISNQTLCPGEALFVDATAAGATDYVWGDGAQDAMRSIEEPGTYVVTISNACSATMDTLVVTAGQALGPLPQLRDQSLCTDDSVSLDATTAGAFVYQWSDGATLPTRTLDTPGDYALTISSGCREEVLAFTLSGQSCCQLYLPNAFSPNGDGINDVFRAFPDPALCAPVTDYQLRIFNRWGGEVYAGEDLTAGWDGMVAGRPAEAGHYVYTISYQDGFQKVQRSGGVVLLR